jgi:hypothetical protein
LILPNNEKERVQARLLAKQLRRKRYHRRYQRIRDQRIEARFRHWLKSKPRSVRRLANDYPIQRQYMIDGERHWLYGYNESGMLLLSHINPNVDYDAGTKNIKYVCAAHFERRD